MEHHRIDFTDIMPTEVLFNICSTMTRSQLAVNATICKNMKQVCLYLLEHKRKIRLVDDILNVIFVALPKSGKTTLVNALTRHIGGVTNPRGDKNYSKDATSIQYIKLDTKSLRGHNQIITLFETPNALTYRSLNWIYASQSDLCVFILNGVHVDPSIEEAQIKELITGVCHMMSSRDVIVAINIKSDDSMTEKRFREYQAKITPVLIKTIGPCFDVIPIDADRVVGVFEHSAFPWFKGSALWSRIIESQKNTNYDIDAIEKLRHGPFEMQIAFKYRIRGVGAVAAGRILSGSLTTMSAQSDLGLRIIPSDHRSFPRCIQSALHLDLEIAVAGDFVGIKLGGASYHELRKRYGFIYQPIDPITREKVLIDITLAFRMQFVVIEPKLMGLHETYVVHYGSHRVHCVLLWIFPSSSYDTSKDAKTLKKGTAIMVPLERVPMRIYKANEFQKNIHGKVMLTQSTGKIAAIGRIDKVLSQYVDKVPIAVDYIKLYGIIIEEAKALFNNPTEDTLLQSFINHLHTSNGAQNSVKMFNKRTSDMIYANKND